MKIKFIPFMAIGLFGIWLADKAGVSSPVANVPAANVPAANEVLVEKTPVNPCLRLAERKLEYEAKVRELLDKWATTGSSSYVDRVAEMHEPTDAACVPKVEVPPTPTPAVKSKKEFGPPNAVPKEAVGKGGTLPSPPPPPAPVDPDAIYVPGNGVTWPVDILQVKPKYTQDAMRAKLTGAVELEIVVLADGTVGDVRVTKSLGKATGLDDAAMEAARKWKFRPGMKDGKPVKTKVVLVLEYRLH